MDTQSGTRLESISRRAAAAILVLATAACGGGEEQDALAGEMDEAVVVDTDQTAYGFDDFDMDGDSELDADEFHEWSETPVFAYYMQTELVEDPSEPAQTGALDAVVLIDALFSAWDVNDDDALDETEFDLASRVLGGFADTEDVWVEFDVDGNQVLAVDEILAQLEDDDVLASIDADEDGVIEEAEMNDWFFAVFDIDQNGAISRDEWRMAEIYLDVPVL
ncbi:MAG: hypothetical protein R3304_11965 [Longimicrobiales bacterium]|nr:hypothetical protein [Longimicrobiales bacterium]